MKKVLSIVLAIVMIATMSAVAFAETLETKTTSTKDITATYTGGAEPVAYYINITWGTMEFTFTDADRHWDPANLEWVDNVGAVDAWSNDGETSVEVENRSSEKVNVKIEGKSVVTDVTVVVTDGAASDVAVGAKKTANVKVGGTLPANHVAGTKIGDITVTIA